MTTITKLANTLQERRARALKLEAVSRRLRTGLLLALLVGFGLMAYAAKGGNGDTGPLNLLADFRDAPNVDTPDITDEITSDTGAAYTHGVDGQVTLGRPGAGRFRLDLGKFNTNHRGININLSACGAPCDNLNGTEVGFLQSGSFFTPVRDGGGAIIGWTPSSETDIRSMKMADGEKYAHVYAQLSADGGLERRFNYSRPEHPIEAWKCNDVRAEPAKVACTAEAGLNGPCVRWEISGKNGCFRKGESPNWTTHFVDNTDFHLTLTPAN